MFKENRNREFLALLYVRSHLLPNGLGPTGQVPTSAQAYSLRPSTHTGTAQPRARPTGRVTHERASRVVSASATATALPHRRTEHVENDLPRYFAATDLRRVCFWCRPYRLRDLRRQLTGAAGKNLRGRKISPPLEPPCSGYKREPCSPASPLKPSSGL